MKIDRPHTHYYVPRVEYDQLHADLEKAQEIADARERDLAKACIRELECLARIRELDALHTQALAECVNDLAEERSAHAETRAALEGERRAHWETHDMLEAKLAAARPVLEAAKAYADNPTSEYAESRLLSQARHAFVRRAAREQKP